MPAAHWAVKLGIKTAPDLLKIIKNCAVTSQKQNNEEFKVARCGLAPWNTLNSLSCHPAQPPWQLEAERGRAPGPAGFSPCC